MRFEKTEEIRIKSELEPFVIELENFCKKTEEKEQNNFTTSEKILEKLEKDNAADLIVAILQSFVKTQNTEYLDLFRRVCAAITISGKSEYFVKYTDEIPYLHFFGSGYEPFISAAKEVVDHVEFNGQTYTIEEFAKLSREATLINLDIMHAITNKQLMLSAAKHDNKTKDEAFKYMQSFNIELLVLRKENEK